jgi:HlyD family secretion protein
MVLNGLIFLVVSYVVYRVVMARIRWRVVRVLLYVPILVFVLGVMSLVTAIDQANRVPSSAQVAAQIVDEMRVERTDLRVSVSVAGAIQPIRQVPLAFQASGQVSENNAPVGASVEAGEVIARLDTTDLAALINDAKLALELQERAFEALTSPPREVDIASAEAALNAARAQYYAASATAPSAEQREIAELQAQVARTRFWQLQLQRDGVADAASALTTTDTGAAAFTLPPLPAVTLIQPIDPSQFGTLPTEVLDAINALNAQINGFNANINDSINATVGGLASGLSASSSGALSASLEQTRLSLEAQRQTLENTLGDAESGVRVAELNAASVAERGADSGALASARLGIIQAEIALDRLKNGASELQLAQVDLDVKSARLLLAQAEATVNNATLYAPFAGVIAQNNLKVGELPPQGVAVLLMDTSTYVIDFQVDETDVVKLRDGQRVQVRVDALPDAEVYGTVTRIAYTPLRVGQLVTYTVRVTLDPTSAPLRVGMSVTGNIITEERLDVLTVRNRFIRFDNITRDAFVTVQNADGTFAEVMVLLGKRNETTSEVISGLSEGQRVVLLPRGTAGVTGIFGGN